jgi:hypothetical protein
VRATGLLWALVDYERRILAADACGECALSGLTVAECWDGDTCDCASGPPDECPTCRIRVWDLVEHEAVAHPAGGES